MCLWVRALNSYLLEAEVRIVVVVAALTLVFGCAPTTSSAAPISLESPRFTKQGEYEMTGASVQMWVYCDRLNGAYIYYDRLSGRIVGMVPRVYLNRGCGE